MSLLCPSAPSLIVNFSLSPSHPLLLLLSRFSHVRLLATPWTAAHQAPQSLGFSRQEYWSGLPLPSPMHESEKSKRSRSVVSDSSQPQGLQPTRLLRPWDFPGKSTGVGCHFLLQGIFLTQGLNPGLPRCRQTLCHLSHQGSPWAKIHVYFYNKPLK